MDSCNAAFEIRQNVFADFLRVRGKDLHLFGTVSECDDLIRHHRADDECQDRIKRDRQAFEHDSGHQNNGDINQHN